MTKQQWMETDEALNTYFDWREEDPARETTTFESWVDTRGGERAFEAWMASFGEVE